jgi:hypothetical protein
MERRLRGAPPRAYSPDCVEKLFGNSEWVPNGASESGQKESKESRSADFYCRSSALQTPSAIFQTVSEGVFSETRGTEEQIFRFDRQSSSLSFA